MRKPNEWSIQLSSSSDVEVEESSAGSRMTKTDWINFAIEVLVNEGIDKVKVQTMAKSQGVARSSFYHFFSSLQDLQDELLAHWLTRNTGPIIERSMRPASTITRAILNVFECWVDRKLFDPNLDIGVRYWGRKDEKVRSIVGQADDQRVDAIARMFRRYGFEEDEAFTRARVLYFTQIGHYTLEVRDTLAMRLRHVRSYILTFSGQEPDTNELEAFFRFAEHHQKSD
jgi:AcrR family transcriptional regulator